MADGQEVRRRHAASLAAGPGAVKARAAVKERGTRALDAIHLATAFTLREDVTSLVTYDPRLGAAEGVDLSVQIPA